MCNKKSNVSEIILDYIYKDIISGIQSQTFNQAVSMPIKKLNFLVSKNRHVIYVFVSVEWKTEFF